LSRIIESSGLTIDEGSFEMELIDLKEFSELISDHFTDVGSEQF